MSTITLLWPAPYPTAITTTSMTVVGGDPVSPLPTWTTSGVGVWVGTFTAPAAGLAYTITVTATISGVARPTNPWTFIDSTGGFVGRYTSSAKLKLRFKTINIATYSSSNGDSTTPDETSIQAGIQWAEDDIDATMSGGAYTIPFTATGSVLPATLVEWANVLAVWYLYTIRGIRADDKEGGDFQALADKAKADMVRYRQGYPRQLPGVSLNSSVSIKSISINPNLSSTNCITLTPRFVLGYGWVVS